MGGTPMVDGGMTEEQYKRLQMDEKAWQAELEDKKYERAMAMEQEQREYEDARTEQMAAQKGAEELALEQGELAIQGEVLAQDEEEDEENNMGAEFYDALAANTTMNPRPE